MSDIQINSWQAIRDEVLRRIHAREWQPGAAIPNEAELAAEFGCARATVNRALRALAEAGVLDRRRRAGTRVALHPVGKATLEIPVIRQEIEARAGAYGYALVAQQTTTPPTAIRVAMGLAADPPILHLTALHLADGRPYVIEDRWINPGAAPGLEQADFAAGSANEWLLTNAPYTHGEIAFCAAQADAALAELLDIGKDAAVFVIERTTWNGEQAITTVRLSYAPGYRMRTTL